MPPYRADPDEGPTDHDLARFSDAAGYCPSCGKQVYDDADLCPGCGSWITGEVVSEPPLNRELQGRYRTLVVIIVLLGFAAVALGVRIF